MQLPVFLSSYNRLNVITDKQKLADLYNYQARFKVVRQCIGKQVSGRNKEVIK
jgi:hypothetical protein